MPTDTWSRPKCCHFLSVLVFVSSSLVWTRYTVLHKYYLWALIWSWSTLCSYNSFNPFWKAFTRCRCVLTGIFDHSSRSTELSKISFTETKGLSSTPEKQPHTINPPPPNFTLGPMQSGKHRSPGNPHTQTCPSDCQIKKHDLSLLRTHLHCSRVQWWRALHLHFELHLMM